MNRLQCELQRLYGPWGVADARGVFDAGALVDAQAQVRALVLEVARPADGTALLAVWSGMQADLALPAPAVAVNGVDGCQLWFSLQEAVPTTRAAAFLEALQRRYLGDIAPARVGLLPTCDGAPGRAPSRAPLRVRPLPELQADSGEWSAFVAPDLLPMFTDEPWLGMPPNAGGQAQLLAPLKSISPAEFELAFERLVPVATAAPAAPQAASPAASTAGAPGGESQDPRRFLLGVMNDDSVDLALRIEAAKALLPYVDPARGQET